MNPHILFIIDHNLNPDKYTQEQLDKNAEDAEDAADATDATTDATAAAYACTYAAAVDYAAAVGYWLRRYFKQTGENKQDYIDAINKDNK